MDEYQRYGPRADRNLDVNEEVTATVFRSIVMFGGAADHERTLACEMDRSIRRLTKPGPYQRWCYGHLHGAG